MLKTAKQALQAADLPLTAQLHQPPLSRDFWSCKISFLMYETGLCKYEYVHVLNERKGLQNHLDNWSLWLNDLNVNVFVLTQWTINQTSEQDAHQPRFWFCFSVVLCFVLKPSPFLHYLSKELGVKIKESLNNFFVLLPHQQLPFHSNSWSSLKKTKPTKQKNTPTTQPTILNL